MEPAATLPLQLLRRARVLPSREHILDLIPQGKVFAEVGVAFGDFTAEVLRRSSPCHFIAIDDFRLHEYPEIWGRPVFETLGGLTHRAFYEKRFQSEMSSGRLSVRPGDAELQIHSLADQSVDIFYIDAGHSYVEVTGQLEAVRSKINPGGLIILNDYVFFDFNGDRSAFYGVVQATHDFMIRYDWEMLFLALHPQMFCDVAIRAIDGQPSAEADPPRI